MPDRRNIKGVHQSVTQKVEDIIDGDLIKSIARTKEEGEFWDTIEITNFHWFTKEADIWPVRRQAWTYMYAPIVKNWYIDRWCDADNCVNPSHMFIGKLRDVAYAYMRHRPSGLDAPIKKPDITYMKWLKEEGMDIKEIAVTFKLSQDEVKALTQ